MNISRTTPFLLTLFLSACASGPSTEDLNPKVRGRKNEGQTPIVHHYVRRSPQIQTPKSDRKAQCQLSEQPLKPVWP